jgi:hypothetical protein
MEDLEAILFYLKPAELRQLCEQLLNDGILCYAIGPFGLVLKLTETGIEWILSGVYARREQAPATRFGRLRGNFLERYKKLKYFLQGIFRLALLSCCFFCH